ncbi:MAG: helix-turn-helix transcriptional regulator [Sphingobium sp.]
MNGDERRRMLGQFIRSHRERTKPDTMARRRRTPGLRREELATRAGIGVTWCAWIEQGREISISPEALSRLARALALTPAERAYMFELAGRRDPTAPPSAPMSRAPEGVAALVASLPCPAYGLDPLWNACCWNEPAERLFAGWLGADHQHNLLRYTFTSPEARTLLPDWEQRARRLLAEFRADSAKMLDDTALTALIEALRDESDLFAEEWDMQTVMAREGGERSFLHPDDGAIRYTQHTFTPAERPEYKVVVLMPDA